MTRIIAQGRYFATAPDGDEIRIRWGMSPDEESWDPLDFWNVAPDQVDATIEKLREGVTA